MTDTKTGTDVLRAALRARKFNLAARARDMHMPSNALEDFVAGGTLTNEQLQALCTDLFGGHAIYDPTIDRLRPTPKPPPKPLGVRPPPLGKFPPLTGGGPPRSVEPPVPIAPALKPGWAR